MNDASILWNAQVKGAHDWATAVTNTILHEDQLRAWQEETDELEVLKRCIHEAEEEQKRLAKIDILNECFHIWQNGVFGTINGLRLGRLPDDPVPIAEINAGLGEVAFLVDTLVRIINQDMDVLFPSEGGQFRAHSGRILVRGHQSSILPWEEDKPPLPLYLTERNIGWYFHWPRFADALSALLSIFTDMVKLLSKHHPTIKPVLPVHDNCICEKSIRYRPNEEAAWTDALRYFLINLKWFIGVLRRLQQC